VTCAAQGPGEEPRTLKVLSKDEGELRRGRSAPSINLLRNGTVDSEEVANRLVVPLYISRFLPFFLSLFSLLFSASRSRHFAFLRLNLSALLFGLPDLYAVGWGSWSLALVHSATLCAP